MKKVGKTKHEQCSQNLHQYMDIQLQIPQPPPPKKIQNTIKMEKQHNFHIILLQLILQLLAKILKEQFRDHNIIKT